MTNDGHQDLDLGMGPNAVDVEELPAGRTQRTASHSLVLDRGGAELVWAIVVSALPLLTDVAFRASRDEHNVIKFFTIGYCLFALSATAFARAIRNHKSKTAAVLFLAGVLQITDRKSVV